MSRGPCKRCNGAQAVRPGGLCNRCYASENRVGVQQAETELVPLDQINFKGGTQARVGVNEATVADYTEIVREAVEAGEEKPFRDCPILYHDGSAYWPADGFHRLLAHERAGATQARCEVRKGTKRDALLYALGANATHGLQRTPEDKRNAVKIMLEDPEWSGWAVRQIANVCKVSWSLVEKVRDQLKQPKPSAVTYERQGKQQTMKVQPKPPADTEPTARASSSPDDDEPEQQAEAEAEAVEVKDALGIVVEGAGRVAFASLEQFEQIADLLKTAGRAISEVARGPGGEVYRKRLKLTLNGTRERWHCPDAANALKELEHARPYCSVCPACHADRANRKDERGVCKYCHGLDYVTKAAFEACDEAERKAVLALKGK